MIAFLVVTSIINLALGYALAVYLGAGSSSSNAPSEAGDVQPAGGAAATGLSFEPNRSSWAQGHAVALSPSAGQPSEPPVTLGPISAFEEHQPPRLEPVAPSAGMEKELLAGIEEFRAQLAQLKSQGLDETASSLVGGLAR